MLYSRNLQLKKTARQDILGANIKILLLELTEVTRTFACLLNK